MTHPMVYFTGEDHARVDDFVAQIKACKPNTRATYDTTPEQRHEIETAGKLGEVVFSRVFGYPVDWEVRPGADDYDFLLETGETVDVKSVPVHKNMGFDYRIMLERIRSDIYVQALIAPGLTHGILTGWIGRSRFQELAEREVLEYRGRTEPWTLRRSQLDPVWPESFYGGHVVQ